jgi:carbon monoxide dehydrogenase subunit G
MALSDGENGTTDLKWTADITIVGTIASLASRLMSPVTKKMTGIFFDCVKAKIEA